MNDIQLSESPLNQALIDYTEALQATMTEKEQERIKQSKNRTMTSLFYPELKAGTKVEIKGKSQHAGKTGEIWYDAARNTQTFFIVRIKGVGIVKLHGNNLTIITK